MYIATAIEIKIEIDVLCWCCLPVLKLFAKMELHDGYGVDCLSIAYDSNFCATIWMFAKNRKKYIIFRIQRAHDEYIYCFLYTHTHAHSVAIYLTLYVQKYHKNFIMFLKFWIISSEKMYDVVLLIWATAQLCGSSDSSGKWVIQQF